MISEINSLVTFWFQNHDNVPSNVEKTFGSLKMLGIQLQQKFVGLSLSSTEFQPKFTKMQWANIGVQIRDQYLIFIQDSEGWLGFLKMDYQVTFQVLKPFPGNFYKESTGIKIKFQSEQKIKLQIKLIIEEDPQNQLNNFIRKLQKKYITQLNFHPNFKPIRKVGKGQKSCVFQALRYSDQTMVAIKSFRKSAYFAAENNKAKVKNFLCQIAFLKQFKFLTQLNHKNICQFQGVYQSENSIYVILQLLSITLQTYIRRHGNPELENIKKIMKSILNAIRYLQGMGIAHRDLKLENIMLKKNYKNEIEPVIMDFGLAEKFEGEQIIYQKCGTPGYIAPQIFSDDKNYENCDMFSTGVIFYMLQTIILYSVTGQMLFEGNNTEQVMQNNKKCQISDYKLQKVPQCCKDLMKRMLQKDWRYRISAEEALEHPFLNHQSMDHNSPQSEKIRKITTCDSILF